MLDNLHTVRKSAVQDLLDADAIDHAIIDNHDGAYTIVIFHGESLSVLATEQGTLFAFDAFDAARACMDELGLTKLSNLATYPDGPITEHEQWMLDELEEAIAEADDPNTRWISNEEAKAIWEEQRAGWRKRTKQA